MIPTSNLLTRHYRKSRTDMPIIFVYDGHTYTGTGTELANREKLDLQGVLPLASGSIACLVADFTEYGMPLAKRKILINNKEYRINEVNNHQDGVVFYIVYTEAY